MKLTPEKKPGQFEITPAMIDALSKKEPGLYRGLCSAYVDFAGRMCEKMRRYRGTKVEELCLYFGWMQAAVSAACDYTGKEDVFKIRARAIRIVERGRKHFNAHVDRIDRSQSEFMALMEKTLGPGAYRHEEMIP